MNRSLMLAAAGVGGYLAWQALRPRYDFRGKSVVVTGGSRGLGLVLARQLASRGANLAICARDPDELSRAYDELAQTGARVIAVECDITVRERVQEFIAVARQRLGGIDVLVNNAGTIGVGPVEEMRDEDYERSLKTHLWAPLWMIEAVLPEMKARKSGRIVNISSIGGKIAVPHLLPYTVGKFALVGLSNGLRAELAKDGITVTTVCPGLMRTGSPYNAEFKGRHREEFAWFTLGDSIPGVSQGAERAARKILDACARGDAEVVLGWPFKLAVAVQGLAPALMIDSWALINKYILPAPGGVGPHRVKGHHSQGLLPRAVTFLTDRAAAANNEAPTSATAPPPIPQAAPGAVAAGG